MAEFQGLEPFFTTAIARGSQSEEIAKTAGYFCAAPKYGLTRASGLNPRGYSTGFCGQLFQIFDLQYLTFQMLYIGIFVCHVRMHENDIEY